MWAAINRENDVVKPVQSSESVDYDLVIVGGGMVGSMLAAALAMHRSLRVAVLENREPEPFEPGTDPPYDIRVSALSVATQHMLENVGAWQGILDRRACPYREMLVWDSEEQGRTHFKSQDIGSPELGHIVENRVIQLALLDQLKRADNVDYLCPATLARYDSLPDQIVCTLRSHESADTVEKNAVDAKQISTRLLVGADGAQSTLRELSGIGITRSAYPQHALVATVETAIPQQYITWQRFVPTGPEAFLPLCGARASMVWYHTEDEVQRLKLLDDQAFMEAMQSAFPDRLGSIERVIARGSFPIAKAHARRYISERVALVGDAAHTVHPLAGQGVNLGMLDAASLAEVIVDAVGQGHDIGSGRVLRRYERWRRGENAMMISVLDSFYHAFKPQPAPIRMARSAALNIADTVTPLKNLAMRYAMGTIGHLPLLARTTLR